VWEEEERWLAGRVEPGDPHGLSALRTFHSTNTTAHNRFDKRQESRFLTGDAYFELDLL
jgi:hypothetical protein